MCGICGAVYLDYNMTMDEARVERMRRLIDHRGPDEGGVFTHRGSGIGMCRLSIIDLAEGHQPMSNEDGSVWIVYNGEVYNHAELRERLRKMGHVFRTGADTEVVVHAYEEYGDDCVDHLNGMFAFAILDTRRRRLLLARDRKGIKPLYYYRGGGIFLFSSEIKTIVSQPEVPSSLNASRLAEYLTFRFIAGAETLFTDVFELEPGCLLTIEGGEIDIRRYWRDPVVQTSGLSLEESIDRVEALLRESVSLRKMSEVPIGTINSGGVDSSLVSCYLADDMKEPIDTFCVGFEDERFDERPYARQVAELIGSRHHELVVKPAEFSSNLPLLIWYNDEPLNHPNSIPMYLVFRYARSEYGIKVMLSGEGADELFGGYGWYRAACIKQRYAPYRHLVRAASLLGVDKIRKLDRLLADDDLLITGNRVLSDDVVLSAMAGGSLDYGNRLRVVEERRGGDLLSGMLEYDQKTYLLSILQRQDRMSMATSLEARVPFLDHRLVEFVNSLPSSYKIRSRITKYILKKVAERRLPAETLVRRKVGFTIPIDEWFRQKDGLGSYLDIVADKRTLERGIFNAPFIRKVVDEHATGRADHGEVLWSVLNLELWHRIFVDKSGEYAFGEPTAGVGPGGAVVTK